MKYAGRWEQIIRIEEVALQGPHGAHSHTAGPSDSHTLLYALSHSAEIIFNFPQRT